MNSLLPGAATPKRVFATAGSTKCAKYSCASTRRHFAGENTAAAGAYLDWALKPESIVKVLEGTYDSTSGVSSAVGRTGAPPARKYDGRTERDNLETTS